MLTALEPGPMTPTKSLRLGHVVALDALHGDVDVDDDVDDDVAIDVAVDVAIDCFGPAMASRMNSSVCSSATGSFLRRPQKKTKTFQNLFQALATLERSTHAMMNPLCVKMQTVGTLEYAIM